MWEKIRVIFTIPELRRKILLTLLFLAIYRVGWHIPLPIFDQQKMDAAFSGEAAGGMGDLMNQMAIFSGSQLGQATIFGLGIMPYISASIIFQLLGSVYPPLEKLQKEGETRPEENQRIYPLCHRVSLPGAKLGLCRRPLEPSSSSIPQFLRDPANPGSGMQFGWQLVRRSDHDRRHRLPHVARRADRRVRHRQRHQPADHGRHSRPAAAAPSTK